MSGESANGHFHHPEYEVKALRPAREVTTL